MEFQETFLEEPFEEKSDSELDFEELEDDLVERTKIAMVLGAFEVEITDLVMSNIDNRVCARHLLFGSCTVTDCSFDHSPTPWPDDKRLRVLRKARDIIVAGQSIDVA